MTTAARRRAATKPAPRREDHAEALALLARHAREDDLSAVRQLWLHDLKGVRSLEALATLTQLEGVIFKKGTVPDLTPLAALPELSSLRFDKGARVASLAPLAAMKSLTTLEISSQHELLRGVALDLRDLDVQSTTLENLDALADITGLEHLTLGSHVTGVYCALKDSAKWPSWPSLRTVDLLSRTLTTTKALARMTSVRGIDLSSCGRLRSLDGLGALTHLEALSVSYTSVDDLSPLGALASLRVLLAAKSRVRALDGLGLTALRRLDVSQTKVRSLAALAGCADLAEVSLDACESVSDLAPLCGLEKLRCLALKGCAGVRDFSALASLSALECLDLSDTSFDDDAVLAALPRLCEVRLEGTPLAKRPRKLSALNAQLSARGGAVVTRSPAVWKHWQYARVLADL